MKWEAVLAIIGTPTAAAARAVAQLTLLVDDLLHADRRQQQRRRQLGAEHRGREVALGDVAQHAGHDPPAPEGLEVGAHRVLGAGPGEDVVRRPLRSIVSRASRSRSSTGTGIARRLAAHAPAVDLDVEVGEVRHAGRRLFEPRLRRVIDSHTHLFLCERRRGRAARRGARGRGGRMLNVGLGRDTNPVALAAAERHEEVFATVGSHPTSADEFDDELEAEIERLAGHEKVRAVGETGIDHYRETATRAEQRRAFEAQIEIARDRDLPVVIHARDRDGETDRDRRVFEILDARAEGVAGDPPLLPRALAGRGRDRARLVLLVLGDRHLPQVRRAARGRRGAARRAAPGRDRRALPGAAAGPRQAQRARPRRRHRRSAVAEVRGETYEELERTVEANARALFGW